MTQRPGSPTSHRGLHRCDFMRSAWLAVLASHAIHMAMSSLSVRLGLRVCSLWLSVRSGLRGCSVWLPGLLMITSLPGGSRVSRCEALVVPSMGTSLRPEAFPHHFQADVPGVSLRVRVCLESPRNHTIAGGVARRSCDSSLLPPMELRGTSS